MSFRLRLEVQERKSGKPTYQRYSGRDRVITAASLHDTVFRQLRLERELNEIIKTLAARSPADPLQGSLESVRKDVLAVRRDLLQPAWAAMPIDAKYTAKSPQKALEVFKIMELMELIFSLLPPGDVWLSQSACKAMRDTVLGSSILQKRIGLLPNPAAEPSSLFEKTTGFGLQGIEFALCHDSSASSANNSNLANRSGGIPFRIRWKFSEHTLSSPKSLGHMLRRISPCQPPVASMTWIVGLGDKGVLFPKVETYITVGDLYDLRVRVVKEFFAERHSEDGSESVKQ